MHGAWPAFCRTLGRYLCCVGYEVGTNGMLGRFVKAVG